MSLEWKKGVMDGDSGDEGNDESVASVRSDKSGKSAASQLVTRSTHHLVDSSRGRLVTRSTRHNEAVNSSQANIKAVLPQQYNYP